MYQDRYWHDNVFDTVDSAREGRRERGHPTADPRGRVDAATPRDHRADRRREPRGTARRDVAAVDTQFEPDLVSTLNELTAPYRRGDARAEEEVRAVSSSGPGATWWSRSGRSPEA